MIRSRVASSIALALCLGAAGCGPKPAPPAPAAPAPAPAAKILINVDDEGTAILGFDAVAYHTDTKVTPGSGDHAVAHGGGNFWFASPEHAATFSAAPAKYAPQYGGYCAWAVSQGYTADIDPEAWKIQDGRLYLNYSLDVQKKWAADIPGNVAKGDANWPKLLAGD